jgi:hypothetical protein
MTATTYTNVVLTLIAILTTGLLANNCTNTPPNNAVVSAQSNTQSNAKESITNEVVIKTDKFEGVICSNFSEWSFVNESNSFWIPTKDQILEAEDVIEKYLKDKPPTKSPKLWQKLTRYKRQYVGIVVDGSKRIYCNFYCEDRPLSDDPLAVKDGGDCFFRVEYDIEKRKPYNLLINGDA